MNTASPRFSVVIAVYNGAATLARAIDSVLAQRYPAWEIVVVDDGSTDDTAAIARNYGEAVRYVYQANAGVAAARNAGVQHATGDWLAFLDADDWYYPERLRRHAEWIRRDPEVDFLTGDYDYVRHDGSLIGRSLERTDAGKRLLSRVGEQRDMLLAEDELSAYVADHFGDTHTLSVRRRTFLELGGYPVGRKVCEDVHFLIRLCARSRRIAVVCEPLGVYLIHETSATRANPLNAQIANVETLKSLKDATGDFPRAVRRGYYIRLRHARLNLAYARLRHGQRFRALAAVLPSVMESPGVSSFRDVLSVLLGPAKKR